MHDDGEVMAAKAVAVLPGSFAIEEFVSDSPLLLHTTIASAMIFGV